jgi:hypothetical protein
MRGSANTKISCVRRTCPERKGRPVARAFRALRIIATHHRSLTQIAPEPRAIKIRVEAPDRGRDQAFISIQPRRLGEDRQCFASSSSLRRIRWMTGAAAAGPAVGEPRRHSGARVSANYDVQLHIGESRDSEFDASHPGMTTCPAASTNTGLILRSREAASRRMDTTQLAGILRDARNGALLRMRSKFSVKPERTTRRANHLRYLTTPLSSPLFKNISVFPNPKSDG